MPEAHSPALRVAVVTPYYKESEDVLRQCHESVMAQTYPVTHYMVSDGFTNAAVNSWQVEHILLPKAHGDGGDTPRSIGSLSAVNQGFDAIAYLDADNWYQPDHIQTMVELHRSTGAVICTSNRTMHRPDGSILYWDLENDGVRLIDTSCYFLTRPAFRLVVLWAMKPKELSQYDDRIFLQAIKHSGYSRAHSRKPTVAYRTRYADHYTFCGEAPPPNAITDEQFNRGSVWWGAQSVEFRARWERYFAQGGW